MTVSVLLWDAMDPLVLSLYLPFSGTGNFGLVRVCVSLPAEILRCAGGRQTAVCPDSLHQPTRLELRIGARKHTSTGTLVIHTVLELYTLNDYVQHKVWVSMFISYIDSVIYLKAKGLRHEVTSCTVKSSAYGWPRISCFKQVPLGLLAALSVARDCLFGCYYPSHSVELVALRSCQGKSTRVPDPEDIDLRTTPPFS